jgi:CheY-like chemotaxis protein
LICVTPLAARCDAPAQDGLGFAALLRKPVRHDDLRAVLSQALDPASPHSSRGSRAPARRAVTGRRARVLVVEDNLVNQVVALKFLERLGCQADAVGNGREALDALSSVPYGLVLMDVQMPEMDGYEATRAVRSWRHPGAGGQDLRGRASRLPIVAMTANAMDGDREACLAAGMNDYLSKPVRIEELGRILERWLPVVAAARSGGSTSGDDDPAGEAIEETGKVA